MSDDFTWIPEPSAEDFAYYKKLGEMMRRDPEAFERLMAVNPDRPVADEVNNYFEQLGMDTRLTTIEPMPICYDVNCALCKGELPMFTDGYYGQLNSGANGYFCQDRIGCSGRVLGWLMQKAVATDETPDLDDDEL